ncbi:(deoxy)nucleoside triphosphate pyrophosphohydrolase [Hydrogenimonas sp.]
MKIVTAAIIQKDNKVLLARRSKNQNLAGYWEFPGGKLEEGETLQHCLERELFEELNVKSEVYEVIAESIYTYEKGTIKLIALNTKILDDSFQLIVHDNIEWVAIKDLLNFNLAPADVPIAKKLQGDL